MTIRLYKQTKQNKIVNKCKVLLVGLTAILTAACKKQISNSHPDTSLKCAEALHLYSNSLFDMSRHCQLCLISHFLLCLQVKIMLKLRFLWYPSLSAPAPVSQSLPTAVPLLILFIPTQRFRLQLKVSNISRNGQASFSYSFLYRFQGLFVVLPPLCIRFLLTGTVTLGPVCL